jgi:AraC-like DNA-binding protein
MNCRIEQARALLQDGMAIGEVALASGIFDQSHFHRHFKTMTTVRRPANTSSILSKHNSP